VQFDLEDEPQPCGWSAGLRGLTIRCGWRLQSRGWRSHRGYRVIDAQGARWSSAVLAVI